MKLTIMSFFATNIEFSRISKISIVINLPLDLVKKDKMILEKVGNTCPVHNSLDPKLIRDINYNWI